ncbi:MAG: energy transducer TonB [Flavobacteriales bacterium]|nr:energy transducer TonB [Flavobacteriales bacterium]
MRSFLLLFILLSSGQPFAQTAPSCSFPDRDDLELRQSKELRTWKDRGLDFLLIHNEGYSELLEFKGNQFQTYTIWLEDELAAGKFLLSIDSAWVVGKDSIIIESDCGLIKGRAFQRDRWEAMRYRFDMSELVINHTMLLTYLESGDEKKEENVFMIVENGPALPPCLEYQGKQRSQCTTEELTSCLAKRSRYPKQAIAEDAAGTVYVSIEINRYGFVQNAKVLRGVHPLLDMAALDAVYNLPPMTPGAQQGVPVTVQYTLPLRFQIR